MISIIIPVLNQHEMTRECIESVRLSARGESYEFVIIDNGSEPPLRPLYVGFNEMIIIRNEENKGFPYAVNQGIRASSGEVILLLNNDVIVTPGSIERLYGWLDKYSIVGPLTNYAAGLQAVALPYYENIMELNNEAYIWGEDHTGQSREVDWVIGFCMMFPRRAYEKVGQFDESLWPCSGEEIDFCYRARKKNLKIGIADDVYVHHIGSKTFREIMTANKYDEVCQRNEKHLEKKWGSFWSDQLVRGEGNENNSLPRNA